MQNQTLNEIFNTYEIPIEFDSDPSTETQPISVNIFRTTIGKDILSKPPLTPLKKKRIFNWNIYAGAPCKGFLEEKGVVQNNDKA